jgi:mannosyltransferase OCH1-like enzyme
MIPKIIHYCWLGNDPYPEKIQMCIDSWKKHLLDYEFILWNFDRFDINSSLWVKQAFEAKKYAFATDYIRLYALYNCGGIYLDMDVEVIKPFDDLLYLPYFLGRENSDNGIVVEAATFGSTKGCFWIGKCLEYYRKREFVIGFGKYDMRPLPSIILSVINENFALQPINSIKEIVDNKKEVYILPIDYFSPKKWYDPNFLDKTINTYSIHHFAGSWTKNKTLFEKIRNIISRILSKAGLIKLFNYLFNKICGK